MFHQVLMSESGEIKELEFFEGGVQEALSPQGKSFIAYDEEANKLYQVGFNIQMCQFVAYSEMSIKEFRSIMEARAKEIIEQKLREALESSYKELSELFMAEFKLKEKK